MSGRVTIGDFSRASHLSVKTLRHYHEVGLLAPSEVDPGNGYRYYSERQIPQAQVIRRLRGSADAGRRGPSGAGRTDPEQRNQLIVAHLDRLEAELDRTRAAVGLRDLLRRPDGATAVEHRGPADAGGRDRGDGRSGGHPGLVAGRARRTARQRPRAGADPVGTERRPVRRRSVPARRRPRDGVPAVATGRGVPIGRVRRSSIPAAELAVAATTVRWPTSI